MMNNAAMDGVSLNGMSPFGVMLTAAELPSDVRTLTIDSLKHLVEEHRVVVLRGFAALEGDEFPNFCRSLGELQEWDFGVVNNLRVDAQAQNYLYTNRAVPFHWDGAFAKKIPHFIVFHCDSAPLHGDGKTLFCDTIRLLREAPAELVESWRQIDITYTTEKIVHYGGTFSSQLIARHPQTGEEILRFAEPVLDLNPVRLEIHGLSNCSEADFLSDMRAHLYDDGCCYRHAWQSGDLMIADNYVLLHGREAFARSDERRIRRVNVL